MFCLDCQFRQTHDERKHAAMGQYAVVQVQEGSLINNLSCYPLISTPIGAVRVLRGTLVGILGLIGALSSAILKPESEGVEKSVNMLYWGCREVAAGIFIFFPLVNIIAMRILDTDKRCHL